MNPSEVTMADKRALKILFDMYWSPAGWKKPALPAPEDAAYAQAAGVMFQPASLSHDEVVQRLTAARAAVNLDHIRAAFLASLSTRRLELRSALGSYAVFRNLPAHTFQGGGACCAVCGGVGQPDRPFDWNRSNFERHKWGGVEHERPEYAVFDLEQFANIAPPRPVDQDFAVLRAVLSAVRRAEAQAGPRDLEKSLAGVMKSNPEEREVLLQILAYCGILQPRARGGYYDSFPQYAARPVPPVGKIDWTYPFCWWRGADGINPDALAFYFPDLT